ncbi:MAG: tetratricopeptide repeat protein [Planctomycetota bacterium]
MRRASPLLLLGLAAACSVGPTPQPTAAPQDPAPDRAAVEAAGDANAATAVDAAGAQAAAASGVRRHLSADEVERLNDADFRRRRLESYVADTDTEPQLAPDERAVMAQVMDAIARDDLDAAEQLLRPALGPAASAVLDFTLGNIHYQRDEFGLAVAAYDLAVQKHPKFKRAWSNLAQIHYREGSFDEGVEAFTQVIALGGGDALVYGLLGVMHGKRGDDLSAESAFRTAIMLEPHRIDWRLGLAETLFRQRRYADAAALFGGLIREHPERADLWRYQGESYALLERPLEAIENFEMVVRLGGGNAATLDNLGDLYANQQLFEPAVSAYLRALERAPQAGVDRALRAARFMVGNGALTEARMLIDGVEQRRDGALNTRELTELLNLRVRLAMADGGGPEEARALEQLIAINPLDGDALVALGGWYERQERTEQAVMKFEQAAGIEGFEAKAKRAHGQLLVRQGDYAAALPLLRRALELAPRDSLQRYVEQVERAAQSR